jgi:hypothetical protein
MIEGKRPRYSVFHAAICRSLRCERQGRPSRLCVAGASREGHRRESIPSERQRIGQRCATAHRSLVQQHSVTQNRSVVILLEIPALLRGGIRRALRVHLGSDAPCLGGQRETSAAEAGTLGCIRDAGCAIPELAGLTLVTRWNTGRAIPVLTRVALDGVVCSGAGDASSILGLHFSWRTWTGRIFADGDGAPQIALQGFWRLGWRFLARPIFANRATQVGLRGFSLLLSCGGDFADAGRWNDLAFRAWELWLRVDGSWSGLGWPSGRV